MKIGLPYFPEPLGSDSGGGTHKLHEIFRHEFVKQGHEVFLFDFHNTTRKDEFYGPGIYMYVPYSIDIMQQAAQAMLAQANQASRMVIALLK